MISAFGFGSSTWRMAQNDGKAKLAAALREPKTAVLTSAKVILTTPEVFQKIVNQRTDKLCFQVLWMDETFRMTEPETLIGLAGTPFAALRMFPGDVQQCSPIVKSELAHLTCDKSKAFASQLGSQLALSAAKRLMNTGFDTHFLRVNHRQEGGVSLYASHPFYDDKIHGDKYILHVNQKPR